ncbi:hypothetical protein FF38_01470 [Lucilia cuprina]|uniref:Magnesium-dependent phosphatase 1 n=1 Tax=Lucilia cuprina TaxID=7375 RepID=A0A0L0BKR6_LUCCU|nr:hypothetical protein FF38_01470 [Lucilia cuprina]
MVATGNSSATNKNPETNSRFPKLIVVDLDYTIWPFWCDTHISGSIKPTYTGEDKVVDSRGDKYGLYKDIPKIFVEIRDSPHMSLCSASRTANPRMAQTLLTMLKVEDKSCTTYFSHTAWGTGSKVRHLQELHLHTGVDYSDMLFFDDEIRNQDVERALGVCFYEVSAGLTYDAFQSGIELWRRSRITAAVKPTPEEPRPVV